MANHDFGWIYLLFFLIIPLSRIIPRLVKKWKNKNRGESDYFAQKTYESTNETIAEPPPRTTREDFAREMKPPTLEMLVLGELNRGTKNFESIQKNLDIDNKTLDGVLQSLEKQGFMEVQNKQGLLGPKIELILTDKGFKKFYS